MISVVLSVVVLCLAVAFAATGTFAKTSIKEINEDRDAHGKKPLKDKDNDNNNNPPFSTGGTKEEKTTKCSTTDPESGWFRKGEHKHVFAYAVETACDKNGFFRKYEYVYDEYYDCYLCPNNQVLKYSTTNRDGYREYKSCGAVCAACPYLSRCTESKSHVKVVTRHIWEEYMEKCEDIRHTTRMKQLYELRKETIERIFGTAKENHGFRYTQMYGKARMEMKVGLTDLCMNLKKLAKMKQKLGVLDECFTTFAENFVNFIEGQRKTVLRLVS